MGKSGIRAPGDLIVLAGFRVGVTPRAVAEFGEHPCAEGRSYPGPGHDDLSIRVPANRFFDLTLQDSDLLGGSDQHFDRGAGGPAYAVWSPPPGLSCSARRAAWIAAALPPTSGRGPCPSESALASRLNRSYGVEGGVLGV